MDFLYDYNWIVAFAAAWFLVTKRIANKFIILALVALGLVDLLYMLINHDYIDYDYYEALLDFTPIIYPVSLLAIAYGIWKLRVSTVSLQNSEVVMQDSDSEELQTLFIPRNGTNTFSKAEELRDAACVIIKEKAKEFNLKMIEQRSQAHSPTVWLRFDFLFPAEHSELSLPRSVKIDIQRFDFHRFEHTFTVTVKVGAKSQQISGVMHIDELTITRVFDFFERPGNKLRLFQRVRTWPWQLWRPKNKIQRLRPNWGKTIYIYIALGSFMVPTVGPLIGIVLVLLGYYINKRQQTHILTTGKPLADPRALLWMDSWQASIAKLGPSATNIQQRLLLRLEAETSMNNEIKVESIGYWGVDDWVEREQIVVVHRRQ